MIFLQGSFVSCHSRLGGGGVEVKLIIFRNHIKFIDIDWVTRRMKLIAHRLKKKRATGHKLLKELRMNFALFIKATRGI